MIFSIVLTSFCKVPHYCMIGLAGLAGLAGWAGWLGGWELETLFLYSHTLDALKGSAD